MGVTPTYLTVIEPSQLSRQEIRWPRSQAFDCLQYANMEGEGLADLIVCSYVR